MRNKIELREKIKVKDLASIIRKLNSTRAQFRRGGLRTRNLDKEKNKIVLKMGWESSYRISRRVLKELGWWQKTLVENKPYRFEKKEPDWIIQTNASIDGWGA